MNKNDIQNLIADFYRVCLFGTKDPDIENAAKRAYRDLCRTLKLNKGENGISHRDNVISEIIGMQVDIDIERDRIEIESLRDYSEKDGSLLTLNPTLAIEWNYEMNGSLITVYKYLSKIYFHQKKHWPLWLSRIFCVIAAPVMKGFYKGLEVISTYKDVRLKSTITKSIEISDKGHNIIIFPEDSSSGYFDKMKKFFTGYLFLAKQYYKKGNDIPIFVSYYCKEKRKIVIDQPIKYSELSIKYEGASPEEIAKKMLERCNQLGEDIKANKY
jgi:hypothetical protein